MQTLAKRPRIGDRYQLRGTQIVAEVVGDSPGWIGLKVESEDLSMQWRDKFTEFERRWARVETT